MNTPLQVLDNLPHDKIVWEAKPSTKHGEWKETWVTYDEETSALNEEYR